MTLALCLLGYSAVVCALAPPILTRLSRRGSAPAVAVAAWLTAIAAVLGAWLAATIALALQVAHTWRLPVAHLFDDCVVAMHATAEGGHGPFAQAIALIAASAAIGFVGAQALRVARSVLRARSTSARHARSAAIIGRRMEADAGTAAVVIDAPQKAVYCAAGRPGTVVVTSAAVHALDRPQLAAVLAHEDAHLSGRHHLIRACTRALAAALPRIALFRAADAEIARLLEMCADDRAARRHSRSTILTALLALADVDDGPVPETALGTSTVAVASRVTRLLEHDSPAVRAGHGMRLAACAAVIAIVPASTYLLVHFDRAGCLPFIH